MTVPERNADVEKLVDELFSAIQTAQGYSFCSDGETFNSVPDFFARIRGRLKWSEEATKIMRNFLRNHGQLGSRHPIKAGPRLQDEAKR